METTNLTVPYSDDEFRAKLDGFTGRLSRTPDHKELQKTPDGKAFYMPIDFIETTLDELFFGLWETKNFEYKTIANEVTGSITLRVFHPTAKTWIERTGAASYTIMVDAAPKNPDGTDILSKQEKNRWALNIENKKPNALDMGLPKLKTDCIKNAALSLGNIFGRNLNRTHKDTFKPISKWTQPQLTT